VAGVRVPIASGTCLHIAHIGDNVKTSRPDRFSISHPDGSRLGSKAT
jgi:hypothetical protein